MQEELIIENIIMQTTLSLYNEMEEKIPCAENIYIDEVTREERPWIRIQFDIKDKFNPELDLAIIYYFPKTQFDSDYKKLFQKHIYKINQKSYHPNS